jgi:hypothetical protein
MKGAKERKEVIDELRRQGWTVDQTNNGHWKARPADRTKEVVHISMLSGSNALNNAMRDLKRSGFIWPPTKETMTRKAPAMHKPERLTPSVHVTPTLALTPSRESATRVVRPPQDLDSVFNELKEAKTYLVLTGEILNECMVALNNAQAAFDSASAERASALEALLAKKAAFDEVFGESKE